MSETSDGRAHLASIDGLRATAALAVLIYHVWRYGTPGDEVQFAGVAPLMRLLPMAVVLFFALSGFLLYRPFCASVLNGVPPPALGRYARARARRILPAYWVVLLLVGGVLGATSISGTPVTVGYLWSRPGLTVADVLLVQNYHPASVYSGIGPAWSLVVEVAFYLALPLLALFGRAVAGSSFERPRRLWGAVAPALLMLTIGGASKLFEFAVGDSLGSWNSVLLVSPAYAADLFAYGMLTAVLAVEVDAGRLSLPSKWRGAVLSGAMALVTAALIAVELRVVPRAIFETAIGLASALVLGAVVLEPSGGGTRLRAALGWRPLSALGLASYSLYLWHEPLVHLLAARGWARPGWSGLGVNIAVVAVFAIALAAATYGLVEAPAMRRRGGETVARTTDDRSDSKRLGVPAPRRAVLLRSLPRALQR